MGSNTGPDVRRYQDLTWFAGTTGWPWCVAYAWEWVVWKLTLQKPCPYKTASVEQLERWARTNGWSAAKPMKVGDLACLGGGHVTIVERVNNNGTFVGLGGNQRNMVTRSTYATAAVTTLVRVPARLAPVTETSGPLWEVVRGEGEKARVVYRSRKLTKATQKAGSILRKGATGVRIIKKPPPDRPLL
jgi:hypothetical protein